MTTDEARYFIQQNDRGDLLWLNRSTQRPEYATAEQAKRHGWVPLYVEIPKPEVGRRLDHDNG